MQRIERLSERCDSVVVVDCGSSDSTRDLASEAGARVLDLASPVGEGEALRAGMQLARELGYIGALTLGPDLPSSADLDRVVLAHLQAPEALVMGVGPGEAIAGKEWDEARALAEGREAPSMPTFRPPSSEGVHQQAEAWFVRLVRTRYAHPWGGVRVLPLQAVLRRDLREAGSAAHIELLAMSAHAGVPTVEVEMEGTPERVHPSCRVASARLVARFMPLSVMAGATERLGLGGGYAPPTNSPLSFVLAASLAVAIAGLLGGCMKAPVETAAVADCREDWPMASWPGAGDASTAWNELRAARSEPGEVLVSYTLDGKHPTTGASTRLRGILARDREARLRLRLLAPMGPPVADYLEADGRWSLVVPAAGLAQQGAEGEPLEHALMDDLPVEPAQLSGLLLPLGAADNLHWASDSCAVLEAAHEADRTTRRIAFRLQGKHRAAELGGGAALAAAVVEEELITEEGLSLRARYEDFREVGSGQWPYRVELTSPAGAAMTVLVQDVAAGEVPRGMFEFPSVAG